MDHLHAMLSAINHETKADKDHLSVFREFLARLDELQRAAARPARTKAAPRRKPARRAREG